MFIKWVLTTDSWLFAPSEDCGNKNTHKQFCILDMAALTDFRSDFIFFHVYILFFHVSLPGLVLREELRHGRFAVGAKGNIINHFIHEKGINYQYVKLRVTSLLLLHIIYW